MRNTIRSFFRNGLHLLLLLLMMSACSSIFGSDEEEEEVQPLEYSFYSGYWTVDLNPTTAMPKNKDSDFESSAGVLPDFLKSKSSGYSLAFHKLSDWNYNFLVTNANDESELKFGDDPLYFTFAIKNTGSQMFSVYLNASTEAVITLKWDGVEYELHKMLQIQAGYYEWHTIPVENFYGDLDFSAGTHEVELILDVPGQAQQTLSRTIEIAAPDIMADSFEFTESNYFIENNGEVSYGNLSYSNNTLTLHGYGSLSIVEENNNELIAEVVLEGMNKQNASDAILISLQKQSPKIQDSPMVNLLSHDPWTLVQTSSTQTPEGQKWMFHRSGNYDFINTTTGFSRKAWGYNSETSINYGSSSSNLNGTTQILEITQDRMVMDDGFNDFVFER